MEGERGVLDGADQQLVQHVPVRQVGLREGRGAAPAADEVHQAVDPAEFLLRASSPFTGLVEVEEVDGVPYHRGAAMGVARRVHGLSQPLGVGVRADHHRPRFGQSQQGRAARRSGRSRHRDDRALQRPLAARRSNHLRRLLVLLLDGRRPGVPVGPHAAANASLWAVMPWVEAITARSFLASAS